MSNEGKMRARDRGARDGEDDDDRLSRGFIRGPGKPRRITMDSELEGGQSVEDETQCSETKSACTNLQALQQPLKPLHSRIPTAASSTSSTGPVNTAKALATRALEESAAAYQDVESEVLAALDDTATRHQVLDREPHAMNAAMQHIRPARPHGFRIAATNGTSSGKLLPLEAALPSTARAKPYLQTKAPSCSAPSRLEGLPGGRSFSGAEPESTFKSRRDGVEDLALPLAGDEGHLPLKGFSPASLTPLDHKAMLHDKDRIIRWQAKQLEHLQQVVQEQAKALQMSKQACQIQDLAVRCSRYQRQIQEMEELLNDFGVIWIGSSGNDENDHPESSPAELTTSSQTEDDLYLPIEGSEPASEPAGVRMWIHAHSIVEPDQEENKVAEVNFDAVIRTVEGINSSLETRPKIQYTMNGATFKDSHSVPLALYKNGLMWWRGPFRPFDDEATLACVADLENGRFPQELLAQYPDGCHVAVTDLRDTTFCVDQRKEAFPGEGHTIGQSPGAPPPSGARSSRISTSDKSSQEKVTSVPPGGYMSKERFLSRLPTSVVRRGKIIDIRSDIQKMLDGEITDGPKGPVVRVIDTPVVEHMKARVSKAAATDITERPSTPRHATLKVQTEDGKEVLIVKLSYSATVGDLRMAIDKNRDPCPDGKGYQIYTSFPRQQLSDPQATLTACGLTPSAKLHLAACPLQT